MIGKVILIETRSLKEADSLCYLLHRQIGRQFAGIEDSCRILNERI